MSEQVGECNHRRLELCLCALLSVASVVTISRNPRVGCGEGQALLLLLLLLSVYLSIRLSVHPSIHPPADRPIAPRRAVAPLLSALPARHLIATLLLFDDDDDDDDCDYRRLLSCFWTCPLAISSDLSVPSQAEKKEKECEKNGHMSRERERGRERVWPFYSISS